MTFGGAIDGSQIISEDGSNSSISFLGLASNASIVGGTGNDTINFVTTIGTNAGLLADSTYYFGSNGGADVINFTAATSNSALVVAASADYGSTGSLSASGVLTLGSNTITFTGGASSGTGLITFVTVTQATIDNLG